MSIENGSPVILHNGSNFTLLFAKVPHQLRSASWNSTGERALVVGNSGTILNFTNGKFEELASKTTENLRCVRFHPRLNEALIVGNNGTVVLYNEGDVRRIESGTGVNLRKVGWDSNGDSALITGNNGTCLQRENDQVKPVGGALSNLRDVTWHPQEHTALVCANRYWTSSGGLIQVPTLYRFEDKKDSLQPIFEGSRSDLIGAAWKPDGTQAIIVGYDLVWHSATLYMYDGEIIKDLGFSRDQLYPIGVQWRPDGDHALIITGGPSVGVGSGCVLRYDDAGVKELFSHPEYHINDVGWKPDGSLALLPCSPYSLAFNV